MERSSSTAPRGADHERTSRRQGSLKADEISRSLEVQADDTPERFFEVARAPPLGCEVARAMLDVKPFPAGAGRMDEGLKRYDDTPTPRLRNILGRAIEYNIMQLRVELSKPSRLRRQAPKTLNQLAFQEPLYSNFKTVLRRVHPQCSVTGAIEAFFEAYIETYGRFANADITLFQPLDPSPHDGGEIEDIIERAEEQEIIEALKVTIKILKRNPGDLEEKRKLRRLLLSHRGLLKSTRNEEILSLLKQAEACL